MFYVYLKKKKKKKLLTVPESIWIYDICVAAS